MQAEMLMRCSGDAQIGTYQELLGAYYSKVSNKRAGCNDHAGWKISQNQ